MLAAAIIAEYNPFHNGHLYHLNKSKQITGADAVICLMSTDFVQRGEPALISKWARAESALKAGVNLVLELPVIYSSASAETFAKGALRIIDKLAVVKWLCFGTEAQNIDPLCYLALKLQTESFEFKTALRKFLKQGNSFPKARQLAAGCIYPGYERFLAGSNNVLAIEYLKAIEEYKSVITPIGIQRIGSDYKSETAQGVYSSATSIRNLILANKDINGLVPQYSMDVIQKADIQDPAAISDTLLFLLRRTDITSLSRIDYMNDGLGHILYRNAFCVSTTEELIRMSLNKRHTETRIKRALISLLLNISAQDRKNVLQDCGSIYARVLAFDYKGALLLSEIKEKSDMPIITKAANYRKILDKSYYIDFERDLSASDIYKTFVSRRFVPDITKSPIKPQ